MSAYGDAFGSRPGVQGLAGSPDTIDNPHRVVPQGYPLVAVMPNGDRRYVVAWWMDSGGQGYPLLARDDGTALTPDSMTGILYRRPVEELHVQRDRR